MIAPHRAVGLYGGLAGVVHVYYALLIALAEHLILSPRTSFSSKPTSSEIRRPQFRKMHSMQ